MAVVPLFLVLVLAVATMAISEQETTTHIKVYWHDVYSGPSPTAVEVARAPSTNSSKTLFGGVYVIDDALTDGPDLNSSRLVGRAQGMYVSSGKDELAVLMNMNFVFTAGGRYNGSSGAIMGRNSAGSAAIREMPVIGGTGIFRLARGYALATTYAFNISTGDATVEYNVFIRH
uniref:Dirigent protein n=1 Tax=Aegilops tauschii TaxID=37682 RepID=M8C792_AEGTA